MMYRGFFARRTSFGERLSYANVMATLAFFLALGGGAYAATQINGHQIMPHSIPANRLTRGAVVPRARLADNVSHLVLSKGNATKGKHGSAHIVRLATATVGGTDQISLSYGQEVTALSVGAFTITAKCDQAQGGRLDLYATANVDNWYAFNHSGPDGYTPAGYGPWKSGDVVWLATERAPNGLLALGSIPLMTSDGNVTTVDGSASFGLIGDCVFSLYAIT